jgi:hypothetical protein
MPCSETCPPSRFQQRPATLIRSLQHPQGLSAPSQGGSQALENGGTFVGWGAVGRFSEFDPRGQLLFDASVPSGYDTYRAYRFVWHGEPATEPVATAQRQSDRSTIVHVIPGRLWGSADTDLVQMNRKRTCPYCESLKRVHHDRCSPHGAIPGHCLRR